MVQRRGRARSTRADWGVRGHNWSWWRVGVGRGEGMILLSPCTFSAGGGTGHLSPVAGTSPFLLALYLTEFCRRERLSSAAIRPRFHTQVISSGQRAQSLKAQIKATRFLESRGCQERRERLLVFSLSRHLHWVLFLIPFWYLNGCVVMS